MRNLKNLAAGLFGQATFSARCEEKKRAYASRKPAIIEMLENRQLMSAGELDPSFGSAGTQQFDPKSEYGATAVCTLPNNDLLVAGISGTLASQTKGVFLARYTADGKLVNRFGHRGEVSLNTNGYFFKSVTALPGGRIVVLLNASGQFDNTDPDLLIALTWRGNVDGHFGNNGQLKLAAGDKHSALAATPGHKIVLTGTRASGPDIPNTISGGTDCIVEQLMPNGRFDKKFGSAGTITANFDTANTPGFLAVQHDGKIVVAVAAHSAAIAADYSNTITLARYSPIGQLDTTFGASGSITAGYVSPSFTMTPNDQLVAAYTTPPAEGDSTGSSPPNSTRIVRYTRDGQIDTTFGSNGETDVPNPTFGYGPAIPISQPDGKTLIETKNSGSVAFTRLDQSGNVDSIFGNHVVASIVWGQDVPAGVVVQQQRAVFVFSRSMPASLITPGGQLVILTAFKT